MADSQFSGHNGDSKTRTQKCSFRDELLNSQEPIAIVGMGCRLPNGVSNSSALWELLEAKQTGYRDFGQDRLNIDGFYHPDHQRPGSIHTRGANLLDEDPRLFDHGFFGMTPAEVVTMDPLQRKILEVSYEAFENAGDPWDKFSGSSTGVFIGNFNSDHSISQMYDIDFPLPYASTGGGASSISNRVNHLLNLRGPSMTIDTACSSSMYAVHFAVNSIRNGDCEAAIVGGSNLILSPEMQLLTVKLGALSPTSTCHAFDASADGYGRGEGFGALYLKKYSDAVAGGYPIRALIRGTAVNANGRTAGISHPSVEGQETLIRQAYKNAGLSPRTTGYFECHGTGTRVGDVIEVSAISRVFGPDRRKRPLLIGSIKTNLGHTEPASGVIGIMKAVLSLEKGIIPPTVGIQALNPNINFDAAGVKVVTESTAWPENLPRRISINSFGYGGANGHCILDHESALSAHLSTSTPNSPSSSEYSEPNRTSTRTFEDHKEEEVEVERVKLDYPEETSTRRSVLLVFSAHEEVSLTNNILAIRNALTKHPLADVAYTLSTRRSKFLHRACFVVETANPTENIGRETIAVTKSINTRSARLGFVFTGQGAQWQEMGSHLIEYEIFRSSLEAQDSILRKLSNPPTWKLVDLFSGASDINVRTPNISQTVCTALQIALIDLLASWNIRAEVTAGHSSGEIAAAYASGVHTIAEAITCAYFRGMSIAKNSREGLMLAVGLGVDAIRPFLSGIESEVKIAAINSPGSVTLSGDSIRINELHALLGGEGVFVRLLQTGGNAYHSHHMLSIGEEYEMLLEGALRELTEFGELENSRRYPLIPWISSVTPHKVTGVKTGRPEYWRQNLESPVQFSKAVELLSDSVDILIEIGPHSALQSPLKQILSKTTLRHGIEPPVYLPSLKRQEDGMLNLLDLCGSLFCLNYPVNLAAVNSVDQLENSSMRRVHGSVCTGLPTYQYKYGPPIYHENRISREIKRRRCLRHDLLGVLQAGSAKERPSWRNILRIKDIPWLRDHRLIPNPVLPASGYPCLAIEAVSQFLRTSAEDMNNSCFKLRNLSIKSAMTLPEDDSGLEIMLDMQVSSYSPSWYEFKVSSVGTGSDVWSENASGLISCMPTPSDNLKPLDENLDARVVDIANWYDKFAEIGLGYGPSFRGLSELLSDPERNISKAKVRLNTTDGMFKGPESSYVIHPASLDICHQLALIATHGGQIGRVKHAFVPVFIDEMTVWPQQSNDEWGQGMSVSHLKGLRGAHASVQLFTQSGKPYLEIRELRCVAHHGGKLQKKSEEQIPSPYTRLVWKPDLSSLSFDEAKKLFPPVIPNEDIQPAFEAMDLVSKYMLIELAERFEGCNCEQVHLRTFLQWIHRSAAKILSDEVEVRQLSSNDRLLVIEDVCRSLESVVDIKHTKRIFDSMSSILAGTTTGLEVALKDNLLEDLYTSGVGIKGAYPQLERLLDLSGHRNPAMRILEIGAGTGSATHIAMRALGGNTQSKRYGSYAFTDISSGFLQIAQAKFSQCKQITYGVLDINQCPNEQGFGQEFDLVIASQCLHATRDVPSALKNVRKLLKSDGRLILLETTNPLPAHSLAYGTFPDYWGNDADQDSPFLDSEQWKQNLEATGFSGIDIELDDYQTPLNIVSTFVTTAVAQELNETNSATDNIIHIIYRHQLEEIHDILATELRIQGCIPVSMALDHHELPTGSRIIFAADLNFDILADGDETEFEQIKRMARRASSILWLTQGGLLQGHNPKAAISTGLIRMLTTENPLSRYGILHLEQKFRPTDYSSIRQIIQCESELHRGNNENEFAAHNSVVHISRLILDDDLNSRYQAQDDALSTLTEMPLYQQEPMIVGFETPGLLSSAYFRRDNSYCIPLGDDWIQIKTCGIGLNWKDLAVSAGKIDMEHFSSECSGIVTHCGSKVERFRPGDRVYALAWGNFGTSVRIPSCFAQLMAPSQSFSDMASVPIAYCTAVYALKRLARLQKGETLLIQSATGGMGLAAIQIAQHVGAEIFATAGTEDKIRYLCETCHIPLKRIFSSRQLGDVHSMMTATGNKGFDVILSSSTGDMMHETWRCIAPRGRFIDIGRVDVQNHNTMTMGVFSRNATFSSFDLSVLATQDPEFCSELMSEVNDLLSEGKSRPITPIKTFDISELDHALLLFSKGLHVGKIVITYEDPGAIVRMLPPSPRASFDPKAEYILAGGLGGLGRSILQWMVSRGARRLAVFSRSGTQSKEAQTMIEEMATLGVRINVVVCDVTVKEEVRNAFQRVGKNGPIKGILHAAAVLLDRLFDTLPHAQWKSGLAAKVQGTMNLHEVGIEQSLHLDFFVMTSSFEAVVAMPTQAAYCAANSFQDAFARYRKARGLPACSIAFGLITEIGDFGQRAITRNMIRRHGLYPTGELSFLRLLEAAFLELISGTASWQVFDPLAESQITTCLEPSKLARMAQAGDRNTAEAPRWYSDKKFSHLLQAMEDCLTLGQPSSRPKAATAEITDEVDAAIRASNFEESARIVTRAIVERTAGLLVIPSESIEVGKSVAQYGVDSLIAVELRTWLVVLFESAIPLLKLLDEKLSIAELGTMIAEERKENVKVVREDSG